MQMNITKPELVTSDTKSGRNDVWACKKVHYGLLSKFKNQFHLVYIVFFFPTTLGVIFLICIFYHQWYHFDTITIFAHLW